MAAFEWILVILLMIPAVLFCWAFFFKSGEIQRTRDQLRALRPAARHRVWTMFLAVTVVGTAVGAAIVWTFSTGHITLGLAVLIGLVVLNGVVTPLLRTRRNHRRSTSASSEAKKPR
jgi:Na+/H+ antiporter NhaD/arsenite permease-like protein